MNLSPSNRTCNAGYFKGGSIYSITCNYVHGAGNYKGTNQVLDLACIELFCSEAATYWEDLMRDPLILNYEKVHIYRRLIWAKHNKIFQVNRLTWKRNDIVKCLQRIRGMKLAPPRIL